MKIEDTASVPMATLAQVCGFSTRHGSRLVKAGVFKPVSRGRYDLAASVRAYIQYQADGAETGDIATERKRLVRAQANHEELKVSQLTGRLTPIEEVRAAFSEAMVIVATQLDGLAGRMAGDLAGITNPAEIRKRLLDETRRIRSAASGKLTTFIQGTGGDHGQGA